MYLQVIKFMLHWGERKQSKHARLDCHINDVAFSKTWQPSLATTHKTSCQATRQGHCLTSHILLFANQLLVRRVAEFVSVLFSLMANPSNWWLVPQTDHVVNRFHVAPFNADDSSSRLNLNLEVIDEQLQYFQIARR